MVASFTYEYVLNFLSALYSASLTCIFIAITCKRNITAATAYITNGITKAASTVADAGTYLLNFFRVKFFRENFFKMKFFI